MYWDEDFWKDSRNVSFVQQENANQDAEGCDDCHGLSGVNGASLPVLCPIGIPKALLYIS
jgi:hypothetical protein